MKKLFMCIFLGIVILSIAGCGNSSANNKKIAEYEYNYTLKCEAFNKDIKYFNLSNATKGWIVTENNDVYVFDTVQEYNSTDGNCKKLKEKFDNIVHIENFVINDKIYKRYYNSKYRTVSVDVDKENITYSSAEMASDDTLETNLGILLKNNYNKSTNGDGHHFVVTKGDNNVYNVSVDYVKFTQISGKQNGKLIDIFLLPKALYDGNLDVDFNVTDYTTQITTTFADGTKVVDKADDCKVIPVTDNFDLHFLQTKYVNNIYSSVYKLTDDNLDETYTFESSSERIDRISIPLNKMIEEIVFSVPNDEKIINLLYFSDSTGEVFNKSYILTDKSYYRKMLDNDDCKKYIDIECEYKFQKDKELSKIRNDILYIDEYMMILKNGRVYNSY